MSVFERSPDPSDQGAWTDAEESLFPADFTIDEADFASALRDAFKVEREELPPLYAQALLDDERLDAADPLFEQRTAIHVFRELHLRRSVLPRPHARELAWSSAREALAGASRPVASAFGALLVIMVITVALASPSFAAGLSILLGHTGVVQVESYPTAVSTASPHHDAATRHLTIDPTMRLRWLGLKPGAYAYQGTQLRDPEIWSKGPIVELQYSLTTSGNGSGLLDIREFQINPQYAAVLQVVRAGSASEVHVGNTLAVYVDGTWVTRTGHQPPDPIDRHMPTITWQSGTRSELILERDNVVFWIVADQRDGMGRDALAKLAAALTPVTERALLPNRVALRLAGDTLSASFSRPLGKEIYQLVPAGVSQDTGVGQFVAAQG